MNIKILPALALLLAAPSWAAEKKPAEISETINQEMKQQEDARRAEMENYWDAQPEAPAVVPGYFLAKLKKVAWPDPRPVPKEQYLARPEVKVKELSAADADPLEAGLAKKEKQTKEQLEAAQVETDTARYGLWMQDFAFFQQGITACETGATSGAERVKLLEAAQAFVKEGAPRFYMQDTREDAADLVKMGARVKALQADLYAKGQYLPNSKDMLWAETIGNHLAGGMTEVGAKEKSRYYKIIARLKAFDPRAPQAEAAGGEAPGAAPASAAAKDAKWEGFLQGLVGECDRTISGLNMLAAAPSQYKEIGDKAEAAIRKMLASFPAGWQKYPRAGWAHGWFSAALDKAAKAADPAARGMELFKALDKYEAGLKAGE